MNEKGTNDRAEYGRCDTLCNEVFVGLVHFYVPCFLLLSDHQVRHCNAECLFDIAGYRVPVKRSKPRRLNVSVSQ